MLQQVLPLVTLLVLDCRLLVVPVVTPLQQQWLSLSLVMLGHTF
jgi:hypothetical protein